MPHFADLRTTPWAPTFTWVDTALAAAAQINSVHEDFPRRVKATEHMLEAPFKLWTGSLDPWYCTIFSQELQAIHWFVFKDQTLAGRWRNVRVRVGPHIPPAPELVPRLMLQLFEAYHGKIVDVETLKDYYFDLLTVRPFQDGNGRCGGICVAAYSHAMHPERGWLAANQ